MKQTEKRVCKNCGPADFQLESRGYWACVACLKAAKKKYAESDPERTRRQKSESYGRNRTDILSELKKEREEDPETVRERRAKHYVSRSAHIKNRVIVYKEALKLEIMSHYSGGKPQCKTCGLNELSKLALDHVNDDGAKHRKEIGLGNSIYLWVKKNNFPPIFQILCHNCNYRKHLKTVKEGVGRQAAYRKRVKLTTLSLYSKGLPKCVDCGEQDKDVLTIDHMNGGGSEHRRSLRVRTGHKFYCWLAKEGFPDGFQILCFNCNMSKGSAGVGSS